MKPLGDAGYTLLKFERPTPIRHALETRLTLNQSLQMLWLQHKQLPRQKCELCLQ